MEPTHTDISDRRAEANRRNAMKSTGPRTLEGKAAVAGNARKHGLLSRALVLPDENPEIFVSFESRLVAHLQPVGELETLLVTRVAYAAWRLRRVGRIEAGILTSHYYDAHQARAQAVASRYEKNLVDDMVRAADITVTDKARHAAALNQVQAVKEAREGREDMTLGLAFMRDHEADTLSKVSRYETALERSLYRAVHELQRLQAVRGGQAVPPPVAVDVTLDQKTE